MERASGLVWLWRRYRMIIGPQHLPVLLRRTPYHAVMHDDGPNPLIRLFLNATAIGFAVSAVFVVMLWVMDVSGLATRMAHSPDALLLLFILWFSNGLLFAVVQIGYAVWQMGRDGG